jgi:hypothetical protein
MSERNVGRDARPLQLELLKFEVRTLRPFAAALLDSRENRTAKHAAVAMVAAAALALQPAMTSYADLIGAEASVEAGSQRALAQVIEQCNSLGCLIDADASESDLFTAVHDLFGVVEREHARLEAIANQTATKILWGAGSPQAVGSGRKDPPSVWLARTFSHFGR